MMALEVDAGRPAYPKYTTVMAKYHGGLLDSELATTFSPCISRFDIPLIPGWPVHLQSVNRLVLVIWHDIIPVG
jgi:hypothetical protein